MGSADQSKTKLQCPYHLFKGQHANNACSCRIGVLQGRQAGYTQVTWRLIQHQNRLSMTSCLCFAKSAQTFSRGQHVNYVRTCKVGTLQGGEAVHVLARECSLCAEAADGGRAV